MAAIVLPNRSRFAIARRESNLLVPGRKPVGAVELNEQHHLYRHVRWSFIFQNVGDGFDHATNQVYPQSGMSRGIDKNGGYIHAPSYAGVNYQQAPSIDCSSWDGTTVVALCVADFYQYGGLVTSVSTGNYFGNFLLSGDVTAGKFLFRAGNSGTYCQTTGVSHLDHAFVAGTWDKSTLRAYSAVNGGGLTVGTTAAQTTGFVGAAAENYVGYYSRSGGRSYLQPIYAALVFDRALSVDEIDALRRDLYALYRPANQSPFLISIPGGGGAVSGSGDLIGAGSQIVGAGIRTAVGSGALVGAGAAIVGTGLRTVTGTGALVGQGAEVSGAGATGGAHTGVGDLVAAGSAIAGVGIRTVIGAGALIAQGSAVVGVGERSVVGSGDLVGAGSDVSGAGAVGGITVGVGNLVGAGSQIVGAGVRTINGVGAIVAQGSAIVGTGERTVVGAGALIGSGSEIVGAGVGGDVTTGVGYLVGAGSAVTGTGTRVITGAADLVAAGSIVVGAGVRTVTGAGVLVGAGSAVVGSYTEEDCTDVPIYTQFDEPVNALHEAILSQFGEEVTFSGIGLTATAVFKRYKDDVPGGGARPGVPRDVLTIKQTDICAYAVDQGAAVTVRGQAYKVISVERTKHGMTNLGIRRDH